MALKLWKGTTPGHLGDWDWDDSGAAFATSNWINAAGAGVAKPANGDDVKFNAGSQSVLSGLNQSAVVVARLIFGPGFTAAKVGNSTADRLRIGADEIRFASGGEAHYLQITSGDAELYVEAGTGGAGGGADMLQLAGTLGDCFIYGGSGTVTFANSMAVSGGDINIGGLASAIKVVIGTGVTGLANVLAAVGQLTINSSSTNLRCVGSASVVAGGAAAFSGTVLVENSARLEYNSSGNIGLLQALGPRGLFDGRSNANGGPVTIAEGHLFAGGTIDLRSGLDNLAITLLRNLGGALLLNDEQAIAA